MDQTTQHQLDTQRQVEAFHRQMELLHQYYQTAAMMLAANRLHRDLEMCQPQALRRSPVSARTLAGQARQWIEDRFGNRRPYPISAEEPNTIIIVIDAGQPETVVRDEAIPEEVKYE